MYFVRLDRKSLGLWIWWVKRFTFPFKLFLIKYFVSVSKVVSGLSSTFRLFCFFSDDVLMARRTRMGRIMSPRHTLPPNTTCTYYFHGFPTDLVWISFTSYHLQILQPATTDNTTIGRVSFRLLFYVLSVHNPSPFRMKFPLGLYGFESMIAPVLMQHHSHRDLTL